MVNKVKEIFASIDKTVDIPFGAGLLAANNAYKEADKPVGAGVGIVKRARAEHRVRDSKLPQR